MDAEARTERAGPAPFSNPYLAGIGLGLVLLSAFVVMGRGLGASGGFSALTAFLLNAVAPAHAQSREWLSGYFTEGSSPLSEWLVFEVLGAFAGAFLSGVLARRIKIGVDKGPRIGVAGRFGFAFVGGMFIAYGAGLGRGCMSGQALTGGALLNLGSWVLMLMIFGAAYAVAYFVRRQWR